MLSARRAPPSGAGAMRSSAAGSACSCSWPSPRSGSRSAACSSTVRSSTDRARNTYTRARDSSALITSKDGFSVVAPTKVSVPSSRYGRNVSCCALLKRGTSSRNSSVGRPSWARTARAASTAARMSFTPAMTAESAMNCALEARAMRRASVVLPVPGGPQKISEGSCPVAMLADNGLPGPSRCCWPMNSLTVRGRMRSASGRRASRSPGSRAVTARSLAGCADHIGARGRRETHLARGHRTIALDFLETDGRGLAEPVFEDQAFQIPVREAEQRAAEIRLGAARFHQHPLEAQALPGGGDAEALVHVRRARQQHGRRRRERGVDRFHGHLLQIAVEKPQVRSAANHELTVAGGSTAAGGGALRMNLPAELPRTRHDERAGGPVDFAAVRIDEGLQEARAQGLEITQIAVERGGGRLRRDARSERAQQPRRNPHTPQPRASHLIPPAARAPARRARRW